LVRRVSSDGGEVDWVGFGVEELVFSGLGVKNGEHGIELAEVQWENFNGLSLLGLGLERM
jgi:hypothetical protein